MGINYQELRRQYRQLGPATANAHLKEALHDGYIETSQFSLSSLAMECIGRRAFEQCRAGDRLLTEAFVTEAEDAVDSTTFANITGQIVVNKLMDSYMSPEFQATKLVDTVPTRLKNGEKIPGIANLSDDIETVHEGMPYPHAGITEDYVETPALTKRGEIISLTKEAVFFDLTGQLLNRAGQVGEILGLNKEKRLLDLIAGISNTFKWKGTTYDTYQTTTPWVNLIASNDLVDFTDLNAVELAFANMLDPNTGEPIDLRGTTILVTPFRKNAIFSLLSATEIRQTTASGATQTIVPNSALVSGYELPIISKHFYRRLVAAGVSNPEKVWIAGDFKKAFAYLEAWPITTVQAPANSEAEFNQDIVTRWKASEMGVAAVLNPRYVVKSTG